MKIDRVSPQVVSDSKSGSNDRDGRTFLKQTLLLATGIFLIIAPMPDADDIAELTSNFIVTGKHSDSASLEPTN